MKITLYGAAGDVTGSAYHVQTGGVQLLVDFGMFQGVPEAEARNIVPEGMNPGALDAVLLTHGHLDHSGRLPLLVKHGFQGPVFATAATIEMASLILRDSAKVQAQDLERTNRKRQRAGKPPLEAMYSHEDVEATIRLFQKLPYNQEMPVAEGVRVRGVEAGHMLGSVSFQMIATEEGRGKTVVFSGDLGPAGLPVLKDAQCLSHADLVFLESTYGDRDHRSLHETLEEARELIVKSVERKGKILVPAFAVGRTQQIMYHVAAMFRQKIVPPFPVFIDSPMAIEATKIYANHPDLFDEEASALRETGELAVDLHEVKTCATAEESKQLNRMSGTMMIIAGSGMCHAGRILHHLRNHLWQPETTVIIVGYQAHGTLGRRLVEGEKVVKIFGEEVAVKASVHSLGGFSAHAGQTDLLKW
ncbi:MAG TPA: MBL fold hydrolase, partial [Verrucomicrobiales bacterium]|nr:MBL fold hydrolase [Verrucomicrobiales bacterium]